MSAQTVDAMLADYEQSVRWARERAHAGDETLEICPHCLCEVDVDPQPHRPGCPGVGMPRATSVPVLANVALAAAVLEEREPTAREETFASDSPPAADHGLQPAAAVGAESGRQRGDAEPASRSSSTRGWSRGKRWDEATVIAAIVRWHAEHGAPPTSAQWLKAADGYPSQSSVKKVFGSWAAGIEAAGFPRPTRRTRMTTARVASVSAASVVVAEPEEATSEERVTVTVGAGRSRSSDVDADLGAVRAATLHAVNALFDLLEQVARTVA